MAAKGRSLAGIVCLALLVVLIPAGCATTQSDAAADQKSRVQALEQQLIPAHRNRSYHVAPEDMPPPGKCRIWFPGRPPEDQSPPGECADLERHIPPNTWLLRGTAE